MAEVGGVAGLFGLREGGREAGHDGVQVDVGEDDSEVILVLDEAAAVAGLEGGADLAVPGAERKGPPARERSRRWKWVSITA